MNRREFIAASGSSAAMLLLAQNLVAEEKAVAAPAAASAGHDGHGVAPVVPCAPVSSAGGSAGQEVAPNLSCKPMVTPPYPAVHPHASLIQSTSHCLMVAQMCLQHCMVTLAMGDRSLVECAKSVQDLGAVCTALQQLAVANSPHVSAMAKVALEVCMDCEKACRKHETHHMPCKTCADACKTCADECRKVAA